MSLFSKLKEIVGQQYLLPAKEARSYLEEQRSKFESDTLAVVRPATTLEVSEVVKLCAQYQTRSLNHPL